MAACWSAIWMNMFMNFHPKNTHNWGYHQFLVAMNFVNDWEFGHVSKIGIHNRGEQVCWKPDNFHDHQVVGVLKQVFWFFDHIAQWLTIHGSNIPEGEMLEASTHTMLCFEDRIRSHVSRHPKHRSPSDFIRFNFSDLLIVTMSLCETMAPRNFSLSAAKNLFFLVTKCKNPPVIFKAWKINN